MSNLEKVHLLFYRPDEEKWFSNKFPKLSDLIKTEEYQDLTFIDPPNNHTYILVGWMLITDHDTHIRVHMFETFIRGHNFGKLMLDKLDHDKNYYICDPIYSAFEYWYKIGEFEYIFENWCSDFDAATEEESNIKNKRFKTFMRSELDWDEWSYNKYIEYMCPDKNDDANSETRSDE